MKCFICKPGSFPGWPPQGRANLAQHPHSQAEGHHLQSMAEATYSVSSSLRRDHNWGPITASDVYESTVRLCNTLDWSSTPVASLLAEMPFVTSSLSSLLYLQSKHIIVSYHCFNISGPLPGKMHWRKPVGTNLQFNFTALCLSKHATVLVSHAV